METTSFEQIRLLQYLLYSYVIVYFWIRIPQDQPMISFRLYQKSNHARHLHHWSSLSSWWAEPNNFQSFQSLLIIIVIIFTNFQSFNGVVSEVPIKTLLLSSAPLITHRPMSTAPLWARWWWWSLPTTDIFMYILVHPNIKNCTTILWSEMCNEYYSYFSNAETIDFFSLIEFYCEHGAFYLSILAFFAVSQPNSDHKSNWISNIFGRIAGNATLFDYFWMHVHHSSLSSSNFLLC